MQASADTYKTKANMRQDAVYRIKLRLRALALQTILKNVTQKKEHLSKIMTPIWIGM